MTNKSPASPGCANRITNNLQDAVVQYVGEVADLDLKIRVRLNRGPNNRCAGETVALHHEARIDTLDPAPCCGSCQRLRRFPDGRGHHPQNLVR